jgi:two-component system, sensor histidine kinase
VAYRLLPVHTWPERPAGHAPGGLRRFDGALSAEVRQLLRRGIPALALAAGLAIALVVAEWQLSDEPNSLWWGLGILASLVLLFAHLLELRHRGLPTLLSNRTWLGRHLLLLALLASAWGSAPLLMPAAAGPAADLLLAAALFVVAFAGVYFSAINRSAILLWLLPCLGPLLLVHALRDAALSNSIALLGAAFLAAALMFALQRFEMLMKAAQTKLDNDALVGQLQQQVVLVERANRDKSRFLAAASHDLRQPMHALGLFAASLEKGLAQTPFQPTVVNMLRAVDALERSFGAMLDLSKLDAGVIEPNLQSFPIRDLFRQLHMQCAGQAEEAGLHLRFKPGGKIVTSDPQLLERVLANLIHNAIRYSREGGIAVVARTRRTHTSLEVWDTGIGIAEDELPKIFDEFYQVDNPGRDRTRGLGMGLAIVKRLVALMGHSLEVRSAPGRGTVFRILLAPTQLAEMDNLVLAADTVPLIVDANRTVLVIDDEESIRIGMRELLQTWGFEVLVAATIAQACAEVRRHAGVIDVVLSDLRLADQEDGLDAVERVREVYGAPLPVVLVTGDTSAEEVKRAHESGHPVLFKPVRPRELYAALRGLP